MATIVDFPADITIRHANFWIKSTTGGPPRGLDGRAQAVTVENRYWLGEIVLPPLRQAQAMQALAFADDLRGRSRILRICLPNNGTPRFCGDEARFLRGLGLSADAVSLPYSDGTLFSDGTGFALPDHDDPEVIVGGLLGEDTIRVDGFLGRNLVVGAYFSAADYLYRVAQNDDGLLRVNPVLRADIAVGSRISVSSPCVQVQLANDDEFRTAMRYARYADETVFNVVEADR